MLKEFRLKHQIIGFFAVAIMLVLTCVPVFAAADSTTTLSSSLNPSTYGQNVTFTATVSSGATGTVTFKDGSSTLGTATLDGSSVATFSTSALSGGSHSITAVYGGDANYASSTSSTLTQIVVPTATTTVVSASPNPSTYGQIVTFTATVPAGATGTVTFMDGSSTLGVSTLFGGSATYSISTLSGGSHSITAVYSGDANYASSSSSALTQAVSRASFTLPVATGPTPSYYGQTVTVSTTLPSNATGTVTFKDGSATIATVPVGAGSAALSTSTLPVGSHSFSAIYSGDTNYNGSTSGTVTQVVDTASTITTLLISPNPSTYGQMVTFTATLPSGATGTVTFKDGSTTLGTGTLNGSSATLSTASLATGSHSITAIYGGNTNYTGSTSSTLTQVVNAAPTTTTLSSSLNPSTYGQSVTFTATASSGATGTVTFKDGSSTLGTASVGPDGSATFSSSSLAMGSHSITAVYGGNANYASSTSSTLTQVVNPITSTTTLSSSMNPSAYGQTVTFTAIVSPSDATGTVTFKDGLVTLGTASVGAGGSAAFSTSALSSGSHSLTAVYDGDAIYASSTSSVITQVVNSPSSSGGSGSKTVISAFSSGDDVNKATLSKLISKGEKLTIKSALGSVVFDTAALKEINSQAGAEIKVTIKKAFLNDLTDVQKKIVNDRPVYDLTVLSNGKKISDFGNGKVLVTLPYELKDGEKSEGILIWNLADDGRLTSIECTYNETAKTVSFTVNHFSLYIVGYDSNIDNNTWDNPFKDVQTNAWYYDAVKFAAQKDLINGTDAASFSPSNSTTRNMIVTILWRMEGQPEAKTTAAFNDINANAWYYDAVAWASETGIVSGYDAATFGPNDKITREQLAAILYRYAGWKGMDVTERADLSNYIDAAKISSWSSKALSYANAEGLITGETSITLNPKGEATRAQVAVILKRFTNIK